MVSMAGAALAVRAGARAAAAEDGLTAAGARPCPRPRTGSGAAVRPA